MITSILNITVRLAPKLRKDILLTLFSYRPLQKKCLAQESKPNLENKLVKERSFSQKPQVKGLLGKTQRSCVFSEL